MHKMFIMVVALSLICGAAAIAEDIFEADRATLWEDAQESEELVYIDGVPSIVTTSGNSPQSAAMANILEYLNKRENAPWVTDVRAMDTFLNALQDAVAAYLNQHGYPGEMTPEEKEAVDIKLVLMWEEAGKVITGLMEEFEFELDMRHIPELEDWETAAEAQVQGEAYPVASMGIRYAYQLDQKDMSQAASLSEISDALKGFMKDRLYYDATIGINTDPTFAQYKASIDGDMPVLVKIDDRYMTGVGYWTDDNDNDYVIVHDPITSELGIDIEGDDAVPTDYWGNSQEPIIPGCQFILVGDATEDMELLVVEQWAFDFSDLLDMLELE